MVEIKQEFPKKESPAKKVKCSHVAESSGNNGVFDPGAIDIAAVQKTIQDNEGIFFFR